MKNTPIITKNTSFFVYLVVIGVFFMGLFKSYEIAVFKANTKFNDFMFKCNHRTKAKYFTREGKMNFKNMILFMLNMAKKSLQVELNNFFCNVLNKDTCISKQAFSEARQKISPEAFIELNETVVEAVYIDNNEYQLWNGFRVNAVDGSVIKIPDTDTLRKEFGSSKSRTGEVARAKASCVYDVINKIVIKSKIDKYFSCEREMAMSMLSEIPDSIHFKDLYLFDRGYPSAQLIAFLCERGNYFVMRAKQKYSNFVMNAKKADQITEVKYKKKIYKVRVVRPLLSTGEEEILITNLLDKEYTIEVLKELYFMRWGIETKYDELKNRLELENFSGTTKIAIEQDFYASIYLSNMVAMARSECDEEVDKANENKTNKYIYKVNLNVLVGMLKDRLIMILLEPNKKRRRKMFRKIINLVTKSSIPIRPDRHNPRKVSFSRNKHKINQKRSL